MPDSAPFAIRQARAADIDAIVDMCKSSMRATYGAFFDDEQMRPWIEGDETDDYVRGAVGNMLVAETGGGIEGVVAVDGDLIDLVWVALDARGRGIGAALMAVAETRIREGGHAMARLEVFEPNAAALRFYERHGWERGGRYPDPVAGVDKIAMSKALA